MNVRCRAGSIPSTLLLVLGLLLTCPDFVVATDLPVYGGAGGNYFRAPCPQSSYLVGLAGRTGEWLDRIAPVCAPWLRGSQTFGAPLVGPRFGASEGGEALTSVCQGSGANTSAVRFWTIETLRSANRFVQYVGATCASLSPSARLEWYAFLEFGRRPAMSDEPITAGPIKTGRGMDQTCPLGEIAAGLHGRSGLFVDALGLICGPIPASAGAPVSKLPSPPIQAPVNPVTKPADSELITPAPMIVQPTPGQSFVERRPITIRIAPPQNWNVVSYLVQLQRKDGKGSWNLHTNLPVEASLAHGVGYTEFGAGPPPGFSSVPGSWRLNAQATYPSKSAWSNWVEFTVTQGPVTPAPSPKAKSLIVR
jgi:hypothetical protein